MSSCERDQAKAGLKYELAAEYDGLLDCSKRLLTTAEIGEPVGEIGQGLTSSTWAGGLPGLSERVE
jgi:hypothetical protein